MICIQEVRNVESMKKTKMRIKLPCIWRYLCAVSYHVFLFAEIYLDLCCHYQMFLQKISADIRTIFACKKEIEPSRLGLNDDFKARPKWD